MLGNSIKERTLSATTSHCSDGQAANLWYDFSRPPKRSMQTISEIVNGFVEFFIDAIGQASGECNPHFLFHSPDTLRNPPSTGNHFHPRRPYVTVVEGVM